MLAQNFKSADELGLEQDQYDALCKTLVLMETGRIVHCEPVATERNLGSRVFTGHFNMNQWHSRFGCKTVCCIGGTAELVGGLMPGSLDELSSTNNALRDLFFPIGWDLGDWEHITVEQAACALRSFLTHGEADW